MVHFAKFVQAKAAELGNRVVFRHKDESINTWVPTTWNQFSEKVMLLAKAVARFGIKEQDCCATFTQNKPEGFITDFALYANRVIVTPLYATSSVKQVEYILNDCKAKILFVGEQYQYDTAFEAKKNIPSLRQIVIYDRAVKLNENDTESVFFEDLLKTGENDEYLSVVKER